MEAVRFVEVWQEEQALCITTSAMLWIVQNMWIAIEMALSRDTICSNLTSIFIIDDLIPTFVVIVFDKFRFLKVVKASFSGIEACSFSSFFKSQTSWNHVKAVDEIPQEPGTPIL